MSADPYSPRVRELFADPAHAGTLENACSVQLSGQDVRIELAAVICGQKIDKLRFRAYGCPHVVAAVEAACAGLEGQGIAELLEFRAAGLMEDLAVPVEKTGRILVVEDALRSLGQALRDET